MCSLKNFMLLIVALSPQAAEQAIKNEQDKFLLATFNGADDGVRTRDPNLGKVVLYQLSHIRKCCIPKKEMVGDTGFEPVTPAVSRQCSPAELIALSG